MSVVVNDFGDPQLPKKITNKNQVRGHPIKEDNQTAQAENYNTQYDPHSYVRRFPDGTQIVICYGKNPRFHIHHASGTSLNIFPDGTMTHLVSGNRYEMNKGGVTTTTEGHFDARYGGHVRENIDGGMYSDVKGDHATHVSGNTVSHTVGSRTDNVSGNYTIRGNKQLVVGTQDDSGNLMISMNMHNGMVEIMSKGDVSIGSSTGAVKIKGSKVSIHADDKLALDAGQQISHSTQNLTADITLLNINAQAIKTSPLPPSYTIATSMGDKGIHDGIASSQTGYQPSNTLQTS